MAGIDKLMQACRRPDCLAAQRGIEGDSLSPSGLAVEERALCDRHAEHLLKGHGGVMDRVDSILLSAPFLTVLLGMTGM